MMVVIFGGSGFIGKNFTKFLCKNVNEIKVLIVDISPLAHDDEIQGYLDKNKVSYVNQDVRDTINITLNEPVSLICNFAAIHREPGHEGHEYYETNLPGAENVCKWAEYVKCNKIIFTSSIAPYGPTETPKTENSIPLPITSYGGSKLIAEKIHEVWQSKDLKNRQLVIVRPGVVFGAGEKGNVSRLIKAILGHYFFYMGNQKTRKAGIYVKELCNAMWWVLQNSKKPIALFNMTMNPGPTMQLYVKTICKTAGINRNVPNIPFFLLYTLSMIIEPLARIFGVEQPISPIRLKKLVKSNNIVPFELTKMGYKYNYSFEEAMIDWKKESPDEWK